MAKPCHSPNFGARPEAALIDLLVLHSISLPPGHYGGHEVHDNSIGTHTPISRAFVACKSHRTF